MYYRCINCMCNMPNNHKCIAYESHMWNIAQCIEFSHFRTCNLSFERNIIFWSLFSYIIQSYILQTELSPNCSWQYTRYAGCQTGNLQMQAYLGWCSWQYTHYAGCQTGSLQMQAYVGWHTWQYICYAGCQIGNLQMQAYLGWRTWQYTR